MLQIKNISKQYKTGDLIQNALKKVSLNLRDNEFVSILGPSGSGKTTLLNIIGGLDKYDHGDLIINNISTKNYKDKDWDSYRNHTIGFVFQSYNLIPHQSVLSNVELALTISGISKKERREKALNALDKVGLRDQAHKKPNQMSGGQMQRVAIARALVNDPDILLADEPTGALDSETSVQVMELLKEVAKDRLVLMVTHNPELADTYSTRIVKLKDGEIIHDSNPYHVEDSKDIPIHKNLGKSSMSLFTAFSLSLNNLLTKKARTILTSFAGSIGIIGISLILALSTGFQNYINQIQEETLTSYPLTLTSETADITSALLSMSMQKGEETSEDTVKEMQIISTMFSKIGNNDLSSFMKYLEENKEFKNKYVSLIQNSYNINPLIYTNNKLGITQVNPSTLLSSMSGTSGAFSLMQSSTSSVFNEMLDDLDTLKTQYDVLKGRWPEKYNEMILVLNDPNNISELLVYSLGLRDSKELTNMMAKIMANEAVTNTSEPLTFTYDDLLNLEYKLVDASDTYKYNETYNIYEDMSDDQNYMKNVYNESESLKIVGIVCPKEGSTSLSLMNGISYTKELTQHVIDKASKSEIVQKQLENKEINVFSGKRFDEESNEAGLNFEDMITIDEDALKKAFGGNFNEDMITSLTSNYMSKISSAIDADNKAVESEINTLIKSLIQETDTQLINNADNSLSLKEYLENIDVDILVNNLLDYIHNSYPNISVDETVLKTLINDFILDLKQNSSTTFIKIKKEDIPSYINKAINSEAIQTQLRSLNEKYKLPVSALSEIFKGFVSGYYEMMSNLFADENKLNLYLSPSLEEACTNIYLTTLSNSGATSEIAIMLNETRMQTQILSNVGALMGELTSTIAQSMKVDPSVIANAFKFNLSEEEIARLMQTMTSKGLESNANTNLITLGYQNINEPSAISFYFEDFDAKESFINFLDDYNEKMEKTDDNKVIKYTDITGILMSSMSVIVDSVSYVLIAFVSISLVVSSIMIGIITYISVLERTKEIGILRAIGASKKNISSIFNAETFIVGLFAGIIGITITVLLIPPINYVIHSVTDNMAINALLPVSAAIVLIILSVVLTLIGGIIPSRKAAKQDPVTALRSD